MVFARAATSLSSCYFLPSLDASGWRIPTETGIPCNGNMDGELKGNECGDEDKISYLSYLLRYVYGDVEKTYSRGSSGESPLVIYAGIPAKIHVFIKYIYIHYIYQFYIILKGFHPKY
ncbi:hypothetical protein Syun_026206 [Stephania yunnanensis]|uniref:Uncharacterized protein n=1 Tax=Stephania yunnanensis TaxID=152371 RepID=A0AAP0ETV4_9MAGN